MNEAKKAERPEAEKTKADRPFAFKVSDDFLKQIAGYGLATAEILYRLPDHPRLLQSYVWQDYDIAPDFPTLLKFLNFWTRELDGPLHSVRVGHSKLIRPAEFRAVGAELRLH